MVCARCGAENKEGNAFCIHCGQSLTGMPSPPPPAPPPIPMPMPMQATPEDPMAKLIPYKNAAALTAYYLGVFSLIPCLGMFLGIGAFVMGLQGLKHYNEHPEARGKTHAWAGIILGGGVVLAHVALIVMIWLSSRG
jgi:hypothetical protein